MDQDGLVVLALVVMAMATALAVEAVADRAIIQLVLT